MKSQQLEYRENQRPRIIRDTKNYDRDQFTRGNTMEIINRIFYSHNVTLAAFVQGIGSCTITNSTPNRNLMARVNNELTPISNDTLIAFSDASIDMIKREGIDTADLHINRASDPGPERVEQVEIPAQIWHKIGLTKAEKRYNGEVRIIDTEEGDFSSPITAKDLTNEVGKAKITISAHIGKKPKRRTITNADTKKGEICVAIGRRRVPLQPEAVLKLKPTTVKMLQENGINITSLTIIKD